MAKIRKNEKADNYLDYVPMHNDKLISTVDANGKVTVLIENTGAFNRLAQLLLKKPKISQIHLDEMGNFIWPLIDGKRSVYDIALLVKDRFGDAAEPLYGRLVQYMQTMEKYDFVKMSKID